MLSKLIALLIISNFNFSYYSYFFPFILYYERNKKQSLTEIPNLIFKFKLINIADNWSPLGLMEYEKS